MSKSRGILYSPEIIRAKLEGRKTQTRRILKDQLPIGTIWHQVYDGELLYRIVDRLSVNVHCKCPYGKEGDLLYAKEVWCNRSDDGIVDDDKYYYQADGIEVIKLDGDGFQEWRKDGTAASPWKSPLFMPRAAARIIDEIVSIRVERVQGISQEDAQAEGVFAMPHRPSSEGCKPHADNSLLRDCYVCAYKTLWNKINGASGHTWDSNPYVWLIETKNLTIHGWNKLK